MPFTPFYPTNYSASVDQGGNILTHSFSERLTDVAEFDDALIDQKAWKNSRYEGSKLIGKKINEYNEPTEGIGNAIIGSGFIVGSEFLSHQEITYQSLPVLSNESTAIYIANTVVGGTEDPQFATLRDHSYVGINKILIINPLDDSVQIIDKAVEPFDQFHRFITNDFPTGNRIKLKVIDESIQTNLKGDYRVKMNKGYLLKTFSFKHAGERTGSAAHMPYVLTENNSMYLYKGGDDGVRIVKEFSGSVEPDDVTMDPALIAQPITRSLGESVRFRYAIIEMFDGTALAPGHMFRTHRMGPSFASSSIFENKFTQQYYSGSYGLVNHVELSISSNATIDQQLGVSGLGSSSRFIGLNTLDFLKANNNDSTLTTQEKTELHITFFEGTKDFGSGSFDERSIGTFEVDFNRNETEVGGRFHDFLPTNHELVLKGVSDSRFAPQTATVFQDSFRNSYFTSPTSSLVESNLSAHLPLLVSHVDNNVTHQFIQPGANVDKINSIDIYVQGGALGPVGFNAAFSSSDSTQGRTSLSGSMTEDNFYSGSFRYELSFLDKDHTLILNLDKDAELFDGIGSKGLALLPQNSLPQIKNNLEYYLEKAGIIESTTSTTQNINPSAQSNLQQF